MGTTEGFTVVNLSAGGLSLLRVAPTSTDVLAKKGLDMRFVWLAVPLPGRNTSVSVLIEILHRKRYGPLEMIGARFEDMSFEDGASLYAYLDACEA